jgi:hypothetical protein
MTIERRDGKHQSLFLRWIRAVPGLDSKEYQISVTDNDLWIHRFSRRNEKAPATLIEHLQLVEVKTFDASMPFAQRDTLQIVDQIIRRASVQNNRRWPIKIADHRIGRSGCHRSVRWLGLHVLQLSADSPRNSDRIIWDGRHDITEAILIELLRFDRDPDSPFRFLETRRHHVRPRRETHPRLAFAEIVPKAVRG